LNKEVYELAYSTKTVLALLLLMIVWWITEAIPIPATALLPGIILPIMHVVGSSDGKIFLFNSKNVFNNYANPVIFLFLGGFLLAAAMQKWGLDRRLILFLLTKGQLANSTKKIILGVMCVSAFISMWISNTATAAMMLPLGIGILAQAGIKPQNSNFGKSLMLGIAWSASIGGVGTIIGTPPNGICVSILGASKIADINFVDWMKFGVPFVIITIPIAWLLLIKIFPSEINSIEGGKELLMKQRSELKKLSKGEKLTIAVFSLAVLLWVSNPFWKYIFSSELVEKLEFFDEYVIGLFAALLLFIIPVDLKNKKFALEWQDTKFVDWGTLILFGGGIALSDGMFKTGLAGWIATSFVGIIGNPSTIVLLILIVLLIDFLTEVTSNTAITSMMIPIVISIAKGSGADPITLSIGAAVAASLGFMLPVATPPNALVYGTGLIKIKDMIKGGFVLDIVGWLITIFVIYVFAGKIFGIVTF
jgi:sodium-dependent dicarboxylate transporter 2/3/5